MESWKQLFCVFFHSIADKRARVSYCSILSPTSTPSTHPPVASQSSCLPLHKRAHPFAVIKESSVRPAAGRRTSRCSTLPRRRLQEATADHVNATVRSTSPSSSSSRFSLPPCVTHAHNLISLSRPAGSLSDPFSGNIHRETNSHRSTKERPAQSLMLKAQAHVSTLPLFPFCRRRSSLFFV